MIVPEGKKELHTNKIPFQYWLTRRAAEALTHRALEMSLGLEAYNPIGKRDCSGIAASE